MQGKLERAVRRMLKTHRERDQGEAGADTVEREQRYIATLRRQARKLKAWLQEHEDKSGKRGKPRKSNITDNDSAKMKTSHGVIQGYGGVAAVDDRHQLIVHAEAFGEAQEHFTALGEDAIYKKVKIPADSGFHTERNAEYLYTNHINGYVADNRMRSREPRFQDAHEMGSERARLRGWVFLQAR